MMGGAPEALASVRPLLECSAGEITPLRRTSEGRRGEASHNLVQFQAWQATSTPSASAVPSGSADETLLQVLAGILNRQRARLPRRRAPGVEAIAANAPRCASASRR